MRFICIAAMALLLHACQPKMTAHTSRYNQQTYTDARGNQELLGMHRKEDLQQSPYGDWFNKNYADYKIDSATADQLKPLVKNKQFEIFMGTWCGDSKREVPRMYKLLEYAGVQPSQIKLVMVDNHDSTYKQSPAHEEKGKGIHRVPDLLVYNGRKEINRVIESPVVSLEQDLLAIVQDNTYQPNYKGADYLVKYTGEQKEAVMLKDSVSLAEKLKAMVKESTELNTLGYVWMKNGETNKAMLAFTLNKMLYPGDANVYDSLGELYRRLHNKEEARKYYRRVMEMEPANTHAPKMLALLK